VLFVLQFSTVSAGITNVNAKLTPRPELGLAPVMFKVFGEKTEQIIDRSAERVIVVALGEQGFGPQVRLSSKAAVRQVHSVCQARVSCSWSQMTAACKRSACTTYVYSNSTPTADRRSLGGSDT
jgi:hypothetical protein